MCQHNHSVMALPPFQNSTYLSNHLGWFRGINGTNVLQHSTVVICFLIQMVSKLSVYDGLLLCVHSRVLSQLNGQWEHVALVKHFQPLL